MTDDLRVYLSLRPDQVTPETGIGRVVLAQHKYLPGSGIRLVSDPHEADVIACHVGRDESLPRVDVLHIHGLYWNDIAHEPFRNWHHGVNRGIIASMREAFTVTVPSEWVANPLRRDMRINPAVIGHGIDTDEWAAGENLHYIFWGKNRASDVCDPTPAWELARRGLSVISTFGPAGKPMEPNLTVTGLLPAGKMRTAVACADIYLATTVETFGIGTLEALACGVPVLGYDWGGTRDIIRHKIDGYLVEPGDIEALVEGYRYIRAHRDEMSQHARERAQQFTWERVISQYANLYRNTPESKPDDGIAVVVPCHNYAQYLEDCVQSLQKQRRAVDEIIIVDDASTDNSREVITRLAASDQRIRPIFFDQNQGVAAARNAGIEATGRQYVICLDADDYLTPDYTAVCAAALDENRGLGVVYTGLMLHGDGGEPIPSTWPPEFDWEIMATVSVPPSNCIPSAAMFRREMWLRAGGYRQLYAPAEDTEFWVRGLSVGFDARKVTNDGLFIYRVHPGSASRTKTYKAIDLWHPWMRDKQYPLAAPGVKKPVVRSYARPLVTVIIPVGPGHQRFLPAALDSLLGQSLRDWEVVVVDDTGEEGIPVDVLRPYPFAFVTETRSYYDLDAAPAGPGAARNVGLEYAHAPLVLFLDADDYLDPTALEKMVEKFLESGGRYVYTDWIAFSDEQPPRAFECPEYNPYRWFGAIGGQHSGNHGVTVLMARADAARIGFDEKLVGWEEIEFFIHLATEGIHGVRLAEPLLYYRHQTGSRRMQSFEHRERLAGEILGRYADYVKGVKTMAGCCGGSGGEALLAVKRAMQAATGEEPAMVPMAPGQTTVRMEFIGQETGPVWYHGAEGSGRKYRGAATPIHRFANVDPADVEKMVSTGKWKVIARLVAAPVQQASVKVEPEPVKSEAELRAAAEAALMAARASFAESDPALEEVEPAPVVNEQTIFEAAAEAQPDPAPEAAPKKGGKKSRKMVSYE